jgi:hypothetical protein
MLVALGDLAKDTCAFSFDAGGQLRLIFPDHSVILDGKDGISISGGENSPRSSEADKWLDEHCPGAV